MYQSQLIYYISNCENVVLLDVLFQKMSITRFGKNLEYHYHRLSLHRQCEIVTPQTRQGLVHEKNTIQRPVNFFSQTFHNCMST